MTAAITLTGVRKHYDEFALHDIDLELPTGQVMGLVGVNGAGKSTLLRMLMGLVRADDPRTGALRVGLWVVIGAGALLIGDRFAFALQIVFASCWLWQVALSPWRDRPWVAAIGYAVVVLAAALAGFQCFGGPMIGFPPNALWLWPLVAAVLAYAGRMRADATT